jgi:hypothetical protein
MRLAFICPLVSLAFIPAALSGADEPPEGIVEHKAMPAPGGEPTLRLEVVLPRTVWGEWERVVFDYRIVNASDKPIPFEDSDDGRGFAGKLMYLRDPREKIRSFGTHWADPVRYPATFVGRSKEFDPGAAVYEQHRMEPASYFGKLESGKHTLQVVVPAGRMSVGGKPTLQLASAPVDFRVVAMSPELRKKLEDTPKDDGCVSFEPTARVVKPGQLDQGIKLTLANGSGAPISYTRYDGTDLVPTEAEYFGGDGRWRKESLDWCGIGLGVGKLDPKESATVTTYVPTDSGKFVRFAIRIGENGKQRTVYSPAIELKD